VDVTEVRITPSDQKKKDASTPFEIVTAGRVYELMAQNEADARYWVLE